MTLVIVSGGQTGADRAALDFAIRSGVPHDGWCPRGRLAEDGPLDARYHLRESPSAAYAQRTEWNVRDSDATVLFTTRSELTGGTKLTGELAERMGKPLLHLCADECGPLEAAAQLRKFLVENAVERLNVAGPRASQDADVAAYVDGVLSVVAGA